MSQFRKPTRLSWTRRGLLSATLAAPLALAGCDMLDDIFGSDDKKVHLRGERENVGAASRGALVADSDFKVAVTVPAPVHNADWLQAGGSPTHLAANFAAGGMNHVWSADIGAGGGYRRKLTAEPVIANGRLYTMDSDGMVSAFDARTGHEVWSCDTLAEDDNSSNVGGGIAFADGKLFASTGRAEVLQIDPEKGAIIWRKPLNAPARSAPTVADGRIFVVTIDEHLRAFRVKDGEPAWSYQAQDVMTTVLGAPAPAYADGIVIAGFGSGDLVALRADTGSVVWADSLASVSGRDSLIDLSAIRGLPVIDGTTVYAAGLGGLIVAIDLRSGRRLWEHDAFVGNTLCVVGDWIYAVGHDQRVAALAKGDGRVRWVSELPRYERPDKNKGAIYWRGPTMAAGKLLLASTTGALKIIDPQKGDILQEVDLPAAVSMAPVVAGGMTYLLTDDGSISAYQ